MGCVDFYRCHHFNDEWYLIEMVLNVRPSEIDWSGIVAPEDGVKESDWQCAYMEQYLNSSGTEKICDTYKEPKEDVYPCRVAFFIYKTAANRLRTPYGDFALEGLEKMPSRMRDISECE